MGRPLREDPENGIHHVYDRGTRQWPIFLRDVDRAYFIRRLGFVCERYGTEILAYCLMDNHFHLVVRCPEGNLSAAMRDLKSSYAREFNDRHGFSGPLFEGRFKSKLVTNDLHTQVLIRYVERNAYAIDGRMALADYPWSSHGIYLGRSPKPAWLNVGLGLAMFDGDVSAYQLDIETARPADEVQNIVGRVARKKQARGARAAVHDVALSDIQVGVARAARAEVDDVRPRGPDGLIGIACILAIDLGGYVPSEIAKPFGFARRSSVVAATKRARKRLVSDDSFRAIYEGSLARIAA